MFNRIELKELAKTQLKGNWLMAAVLTLIFVVLQYIISGVSTIFLGIPAIFLLPPLIIGFSLVFIKFTRYSNKIEFEPLFDGYKIFWKSVATYWWVFLWTFLWSLLFLVPGIIKAISYSMTFYIVADNPNVTVADAMKVSMKMTNGYKMDIFVMALSFLGWAILASFTLGIGYFFLMPYVMTTYTNSYFKLKELAIDNGVCLEGEFDGSVKIVY